MKTDKMTATALNNVLDKFDPSEVRFGVNENGNLLVNITAPDTNAWHYTESVVVIEVHEDGLEVLVDVIQENHPGHGDGWVAIGSNNITV